LSVAALISGAMESEAIARIELTGAYGSLKEVLEGNLKSSQMPEQFCFGLLAEFDVPQIAALAVPRPVVFHAPSQRVRKELAPLSGWYKLHGVDHDPTRHE
jgi:hypothetical protein